MTDQRESLLQRIRRVARNQGIRILVRQSIKFARDRLVGRIGIEYAYRRFREVAGRISSLDEAVSFAYSFRYLGVSIHPWQEREEVAQFLKIVEKNPPKVVVEIGAGLGGTLFLFTRVAAPDATIVSLDLPASLTGKGPPAWKDSLFLSFARLSQQIHLIRRNSHDARTLVELRSKLGDKKVDVLFIDGDHSYNGVKMDFEMYSHLVRPGGLVVFHDIDQDHWNPEVQVPRIWRELKSKYETLEISIHTHGSGIGIIYLP